MRQLTIDPEFRDKIPPLSEDEFQKLEQNILEDGEVREPLVVWHNTIIDGHHRWKIIQKHNLTNYKIKQMDFPDKWAAIVWMCRNQLGRRNLTDEQRSYLRGKQYEAEKMSQGGDRRSDEFSSGQNVLLNRREVKDGTAGRIGKEYGVDGRTIRRDADFSNAVDSAEELGELIDAAAKALDFSLKQHLVLVHRDVLDTQNGRDAAKKSLNGVLAITQKYFEMIRRIEESAE